MVVIERQSANKCVSDQKCLTGSTKSLLGGYRDTFKKQED